MENHLIDTLDAVNRISQNPRLDLNRKLKEILAEIVKCMGTRSGSVMIVKSRKQLEVTAATNPELVGLRQPLDSDSPSAWVVRNKKTLNVDVDHESPFYKGENSRYEKDAFLIAPIMSNNRVIGVVSVTDKLGPDRFMVQEQKILLSMAGQVIGALENHRLAEALKKKKSDLKKKNAQLMRLEKIRTELFNMLIHDLKGPISEIVANLDILSYTVMDENKEYVATAQHGCDTLFRMISDLLDIARMEDGTLKLLIERIDPMDLVNEALSRIQTMADSRGVKLTTRTPSLDKDVVLLGDRGLLLRVLQNLLTNAIHHSPPGAEVEAGFELEENGAASFFVKDQGPGIAPKYQEAIFDKFFQITKGGDGRKYTAGLGLAFCKMAVTAHNGAIGVESDGSLGSLFRFRIPMEQQG